MANTGFEGYVSSHHGDLAFHAPTALRLIGARELAELAEEANAQFGVDGPVRDRRVRSAQLKAESESAQRTYARLDDRFFASKEDVDELLDAYRRTTATAR